MVARLRKKHYLKHMKLIVIISLLLTSGSVLAQEPVDLESYLWEKRPIVVFANSDQDPSFKRQIRFFENRAEELEERDVVVLVDTDPTFDSELRQELRPRGFTLVLIGKDGGVKLRKPRPWTVREIGRVIDKMPIRQEEMDRR